jgi:S1-C subfamily serine protease
MRSSVIVLAAVLFLTGMTAGVVLTGRLRTQVEGEDALVTRSRPTQTAAPLEDRPRLAAQAAPAVRATGPDFTDVAESTIPAVTNISSRQVVRQRSRFGDDPFFRYFFGDTPGFSGYRERPSLGSGVIVRSDGDADGLPTVPWGDSTALRIAEWVLAVGNPFQLNQTVTLGIVSAVGRDNLGVARYEDFIQTDAAINPGNSGGALINSSGELVGINTAIYSDSGGYQGIGFAVPSNLARRVMDDLIAYGEVHRGSFGYVNVRALTTPLARELDTRDMAGVVVWRIHRDSSAAQAGIEPGDVVVSFNGDPVEDLADYGRLLSDAEIGSTVTLGVSRYGRPLEFEVEVSQAPRQR